MEYRVELEAARERARAREQQARTDRSARRLLRLAGMRDVTQASLLLAAMHDEEFAEIARTRPQTMQEIVDRAMEFSTMESMTGRRLTPEEVAAVGDAKKELRERVRPRVAELAADPEMGCASALKIVQKEFGREIRTTGLTMNYMSFYQTFWTPLRGKQARKPRRKGSSSQNGARVPQARPASPTAPIAGSIAFVLTREANGGARLTIDFPPAIADLLKVLQS